MTKIGFIQIGFLISILCCIALPLNAGKKKQTVQERAEHILDTRYSNTAKQQEQLIKHYKTTANNQPMYPDDLSIVVMALAHEKNLPSIAYHEEILQESIELFWNVPGFLERFKHIVRNSHSENNANFKGALYELELAIRIEKEDNGEHIEEFSKKIIDASSNRVLRVIDLATNQRWIECKDIETQGKKLHAIKTQIASQKKLASIYSKNSDHPVNYEVHFKAAISESFKSWLERNKVHYVCPIN